MFKKILLSALCAAFPFVLYADPLASCTNIGGAAYQTTPPTYTITGTTYNICAGCPDGETFADVNSLVLNSGDAVLFKAGESFTLSNESNRIDAVGGVLYGRYGTGSNPVLQGSAGLTFSVGFRGLFEADGVNNVTVDGIDFNNSPSFGLMFRDSADSSLSNSTVTNMEGCAVCFIRAPRAVADKNVINANPGGPHESLTFTGVETVDYVASNNRICGNDHASINNKNGVSGGEIFGNELCQESNDPTLYLADSSDSLKVHDNWVHTAIGNYKGLLTLGAEQPGGYSRNHEVWNNVIETTNKHGLRFWLRATVDCPTAGADQLVHGNHIHHNTIIDTGNSGNSWDYAVTAVDLRDDIANDTQTPGCGSDPDDWSANIIENNIIWATDNADAISFKDGTEVGFTVRYNLFETGETASDGGSTFGTNSITTGTAPFVDLASKDFDPAGAAIGAGSDGSDVGATINWTCGLGTNPNPDPDPLQPIVTAKPDPHSINVSATHYPDHLWVMNDATGGTTMEDEGSSATDCDLTINGANQSSDTLGKYWVFNASETDTMSGSCADPPTTTGVTCMIYQYPTAPQAVQTPVSWGDADDAFQVAAINILNGSGNPRAALCVGPSSCSGGLNTASTSITDENLNMVCVRQSATTNDIWVNDGGWEVSSLSTLYDWSQIDQFTIGAQGRSTDDQYATGYLYAVFSFDGDKTNAELSALYNDSGSGGDPWANLGIEAASPPPGNEVTDRGQYPNPAN